jgi:hypothetical protein
MPRVQWKKRAKKPQLKVVKVTPPRPVAISKQAKALSSHLMSSSKKIRGYVIGVAYVDGDWAISADGKLNLTHSLTSRIQNLLRIQEEDMMYGFESTIDSWDNIE